MSVRHEQTRALLHAKLFLFDLLDPKRRPKTARELKRRAAQALRHFPALKEDGTPIWSKL